MNTSGFIDNSSEYPSILKGSICPALEKYPQAALHYNVSAITPKQAAYLSFLGVKLPATSSEASRLIQEAHDTKDDSLWQRCEMWKIERAWLHPDLYPGELANLRAARIDAVYEFNNRDRGVGCPLKKLTKLQVQKVIDYLDANYAGWDRKFWLPLRCISPDIFYDYFVAAAWHVDPGLFKRGYSPLPKSEQAQYCNSLPDERRRSGMQKKPLVFWWIVTLCLFAALGIVLLMVFRRA